MIRSLAVAGLCFVFIQLSGIASVNADDNASDSIIATNESTDTSGEFRLLPESNKLFADESDDRTTLGRRLWAAPRWERRTGNDGVFPIDGDLNGVSFGWRSRNVDSLFLSVEGVIMDGGFDPTAGGKTDYQEWQIEGLLGYTFGSENEDTFLTPYLGFRYREAENELGPPLNLDVLQEAWSLPLGIRADHLLSDDIAIGIDARMQWKIDDDQVVTGAASIVYSSSNQLTYRIAAPFTIRLSENSEIELRPHYEWDRFDSDSGTRETRIEERGGQVTFILRY